MAFLECVHGLGCLPTRRPLLQGTLPTLFESSDLELMLSDGLVDAPNEGMEVAQLANADTRPPVAISC